MKEYDESRIKEGPIKELHKHIYEIPKVEPQLPENNRQVSIITLNTAVHLISTYPQEHMDYLITRAVGIYDKITRLEPEKRSIDHDVE